MGFRRETGLRSCGLFHGWLIQAVLGNNAVFPRAPVFFPHCADNSVHERLPVGSVVHRRSSDLVCHVLRTLTGNTPVFVITTWIPYVMVHVVDQRILPIGNEECPFRTEGHVDRAKVWIFRSHDRLFLYASIAGSVPFQIVLQDPPGPRQNCS